MATVDPRAISASGAPYATLDLWEADADIVYPSGLVTPDVIWQGRIASATDNFIGTTETMLTVAGTTVGPNNYKELTAETGAAFYDNIGSNPLKYSESYGCSIRSGKTFGSVVSVTENYFRMSGVQVRATGNSGRAMDAGVTGLRVDRCIIEGQVNNAYVAYLGANSAVTSNSLIVQRKDSATAIVKCFGSASFYNNTIICPNSLTDTVNAFEESFATGTVKNCAIFGTQNVSNNTGLSYVTCATDVAVPPSGFTVLAYDTTTGSGFENITDTAYDFRTKETSSLLESGTDETTYASVDILGTARPAGLYDIGAFQLPATSIDLTAPFLPHSNQFFPATIGQNLVLTAARHNETNTFNAHSISQTLTLSAARHNEINTFNPHSINFGTVDLVAPFHGELPLFYTHTINLVTDLSAPFTPDSNQFFASSVGQTLTLSATRHDESNAFNTHNISQLLGLAATRHDESNTFNTHSINQTLALAASRYDNSSTFNAHVITLGGGTQTLIANLFTNDNTFNTHSISQLLDINAVRYNNQNSFYVHTLTIGAPVTNLSAALFTNQNTFFPAQILVDLPLLTATLYQNSNTFYQHIVIIGAEVETPPSRTYVVQARKNIYTVYQ